MQVDLSNVHEDIRDYGCPPNNHHYSTHLREERVTKDSIMAVASMDDGYQLMDLR